MSDQTSPTHTSTPWLYFQLYSKQKNRSKPAFIQSEENQANTMFGTANMTGKVCSSSKVAHSHADSSASNARNN